MVEDVQAAPAALALQPVGRIGHELELLEDELGNDERPLDEPRVAEVGDAAVDDDARVEDLVAAAGAFSLKKPEEVGRVEPLRLPRPDEEPDVGHDDQEEDADEGGHLLRADDGLVDRAEHPAEEDADEQARCRRSR